MNQVKVGRKPIPVVYNHVSYNGKTYCIGVIKSKHGEHKFVIDGEDSEKVMERSWHITSVGYVVSYYPTDDGIKQLLLHRFVLNRMDFPGKGASETVDHINRNPLDNRKENLRIMSQTEQNLNQKKKTRTTTELPEGCGINPDDLPRHIWYIKPNGGHGDRFAIECKMIGLTWKTTSSKQVSLSEKLRQAKEKLQEIYVEHPELNPELQQESIHPLFASFEEIIASIQ